MLRGTTGPFKKSPKGPIALWGAYALAMVSATQLVFDVATAYDIGSTDATGDPTYRVVVMLLLVVACALAAVMAMPHVIGENKTLDLLALALTFLAAFVDPWFGSIAMAIVALIVMGCGGILGTIMRWGAVIASYQVLYIDDGSAMVTLALVMTVLVGTLTLLIIVWARMVGMAFVLTVLFGVAVVTGLTASLG